MSSNFGERIVSFYLTELSSETFDIACLCLKLIKIKQLDVFPVKFGFDLRICFDETHLTHLTDNGSRTKGQGWTT